jgi:biopolymer transport protein ExbD
VKINLDTLTDDVQIQILPLMDVIFCILTFFILGAVGLSRQQAISVDLPKASTGEPQMREMFIVVVDPVGQTSIEVAPGQWTPIGKKPLTAQLKTYIEQKPNGLIVLYAHPMANYNNVVQVLDVLRGVGGNRVALATLPGSAPELPNPRGGDRFQPQTPSLNPSPGLPTFPSGQPGLNPASPLSPSPSSPSPLNPLAPSTPGLNPSPGTQPNSLVQPDASSPTDIPTNASPPAPGGSPNGPASSPSGETSGTPSDAAAPSTTPGEGF